MIAYQFASFYQELLERHEKAAEIAMECDTRLASIISSQGNIAD